LLRQQLGTDLKWSQINDAFWSAIEKSERGALSLADLSPIADAGGWKQSELLAVLGLLGAPKAALLRMELRAPDGAEVPVEEVSQKLAAWWKTKTMTDAEWKAWATQYAVSWSSVAAKGVSK
jgi:hypothetical protein